MRRLRLDCSDITRPRNRFFTTEDPIGKPINVGGTRLTGVGVLVDRQVTAEASKRLGIRDANMDTYIPVMTSCGGRTICCRVSSRYCLPERQSTVHAWNMRERSLRFA
jgi:hypothetical protein